MRAGVRTLDRRASFESLNQTPAEEKRDRAEDTEAAIDETPAEGDAADGAGDQREWNDAGAGDEAEGDDPLVAHGIDERADEEDGENEVGEGEPVGAVGEERELGVGGGDG